MIETFLSLGQLDSPRALFMSFVIGILFGGVLEQAGFGSSKRLSGVFYFRDMAVIKVMFTAMITAIICLALALRFGVISEPAMYLNPTVYTPQILGGLIFGIGFVMGGWCPGTAAAGAASGKLDAGIFLLGAAVGSILFNETYGLVKGMLLTEDQHVAYIYDAFGIAKDGFILIFALGGILVFWAVEWIEKQVAGTSEYWKSDFLKRFSFGLAVASFASFLVLGAAGDRLPQEARKGASFSGVDAESRLLASLDQGVDHIEPEDLARKIISGHQEITLVDVRPLAEFSRFHIRTANQISMENLFAQLQPYKNRGMIVLYSNGMTHPAQARDALHRQGFNNAYILTDGLDGFVNRCLMPVSIRPEPVPELTALEINQWRNFFLEKGSGSMPGRASAEVSSRFPEKPGVVDAKWVSEQVARQDLCIIDLRSQPDYNHEHIPDSFCLNVESLRGNLKGVPSCLLPAPVLSAHLSLMGITPQTGIILVYGDKVQDATLAGMALERLGHLKYAVLSGGYTGWKKSGNLVDNRLPSVAASLYPDGDRDTFSVDYQTVYAHMKKRDAIILDVRPEAYYSGEKSDEARAGHIPGAINRPYDKDTVKNEDGITFRQISELESAYGAILPSKQSMIIVHCRTGHQASQTFFVLKNMLGYENVHWYDAGWTQWAAVLELPVKTGLNP